MLGVVERRTGKLIHVEIHVFIVLLYGRVRGRYRQSYRWLVGLKSVAWVRARVFERTVVVQAERNPEVM